jgi:hypothetical protein
MLKEFRMHLNPSSKYPELHTPSKKSENGKRLKLSQNSLV